MKARYTLLLGVGVVICLMAAPVWAQTLIENGARPNSGAAC
jgi:hypothetical protein